MNACILNSSISLLQSAFVNALADLNDRQTRVDIWGTDKAFPPCACECGLVITTDGWKLSHKLYTYTAESKEMDFNTLTKHTRAHLNEPVLLSHITHWKH